MRHVENNGEALTTDARLRDCVRASLDVPELAETVFKRIQPFLEPEITVDGTEESRMLGLPYGDDSVLGVWRPCGVNPIIRICKYPGDGRGHFGPHHDSAVTLGTHERSLLTLNGYLNALPEGAGGCTRFLIDELQGRARPLHDRGSRVAGARADPARGARRRRGLLPRAHARLGAARAGRAAQVDLADRGHVQAG